MRHYRKTYKTYSSATTKDKKRTDICTLCNDYENSKGRIVAENGTMFLMANRVKYDMFEGQRVADHLMIMPKRHVETLADFTEAEKIDQMTILGDYEKQGYDVYARGVGNIMRSVKHQHTHLIKTVNKHAKFLLYMEKPYVVIDF